MNLTDTSPATRPMTKVNPSFRSPLNTDHIALNVQMERWQVEDAPKGTESVRTSTSIWCIPCVRCIKDQFLKILWRHFRWVSNIARMQDALKDLCQGSRLWTQDSRRLFWEEMLLPEDALQPRIWSQVENREDDAYWRNIIQGRDSRHPPGCPSLRASWFETWF